MRPAWESRKRRPRFIHPVIQSASMSACSFQVVRVIEQLLSLSDVQLEKCGIKKEAAPNGAAS